MHVQAAWAMSAQGKSVLLCLTLVPALGAVRPGLMLLSLRLGATTRPVLGEFCAGILDPSLDAGRATPPQLADYFINNLG